ncbi:MAG: metallophosphoesterase [Planctomycetaceae bacterium]|nr:metallophosphoesterase [Planctomycetaceae bacterium]
MYDLIGDIHGHASELIQLLEILGYRKNQGVYEHPERRVIFLGDFIDRGPQILQVLETVRSMVETGNALAVMGNHEFNALAFHTEHVHRKEEYLRRRNIRNIRQHGQTILQLTDKHLAASIEWFATLPMWLDLDGLRVVHACWDDHAMATINAARPGNEPLTSDFMHAACEEGTPLFNAVEIVLKGKEIELPSGHFYVDKEGHVRTAARTRWWMSPLGQTYRTFAMTAAIQCDDSLAPRVIETSAPYPPDAKPVFLGHYWLSGSCPELLADNVACVDYSVAKDGFLCAYRWNGEQKLSSRNFVWAGSQCIGATP